MVSWRLSHHNRRLACFRDSIFYLVLRKPSDTQAAAGSSKRGPTGPVTVTIAKAKTGDIGVYVEAIGTVTPVYTDSITSQVNGLVTKVYFRRRADGRERRSADRH